MEATEYQKQATRTENTPIFIDHHRRKLRESGIDPRVANVSYAAAERADLVLSRLMHAVMGMITELGEFVDPQKKLLIYGKPYDATNLQEEIGDSEWYAALAANALEAQLVDIFERNIAKLRVRFPDKFTEENALNRDLDGERKALEAASSTFVHLNPSAHDFDNDRDADHALIALRRIAQHCGVDGPRKLRDSSNKRITELCCHYIDNLRSIAREGEKARQIALDDLNGLRAKIKAFNDVNGA